MKRLSDLMQVVLGVAFLAVWLLTVRAFLRPWPAEKTVSSPVAQSLAAAKR